MSDCQKCQDDSYDDPQLVCEFQVRFSLLMSAIGNSQRLWAHYIFWSKDYEVLGKYAAQASLPSTS